MSDLFMTCKNCGEIIHGITSYKVFNRGPGRTHRYICHECQEKLNKLSHIVDFTEKQREKFKDLLRISLTGE